MRNIGLGVVLGLLLGLGLALMRELLDTSIKSATDIAELTETKSELERFQVNAITGGMDALGEVSVTVGEDGRRVIGNGAGG